MKANTIFLVFMISVLSGCTVGSSAYTPLPTIKSRPDFVLEVTPSESEVLPVHVFNAKFDNTLEEVPEYNSQVCIKVQTILLAEEGDNFVDNSTFEERVIMSVNNFEMQSVYVFSDGLESMRAYDTDGNPIMMGIEPKRICTRIKLDVGIHSVLFKFNRSSSEFQTYKWQFELTND